MIGFLRFLTRYEWGYRLILRLFIASGATLFPVMTMWPSDKDYFTVFVFATNEFQWNSCISSYRVEG